MRITAKTVAAARMPAGKSDHIIWDDALVGFGLRMRGEHRAFIVQYRSAGQTRRIKIGDVEKLGADQARGKAKAILASVALGGDPQADRRRMDEPQDTLLQTVDVYLAAKRDSLRANTRRAIDSYLRGPYFEALHGKLLDAVTRRDVASRVMHIEHEHGRATASRARAVLSAFYAWCMGQGLADANPVIGTNNPGSTSRDRVLSDAELADVWRACGDDYYGRIVKLLVLTGCRRQEIGSLKWGDIDLAECMLTIAAERSKNGRAHTLPLPGAALDIINSTPRIVGRDFMFGSRGEGFASWSLGKRALDARLGELVGPWVLHDIRRTFCTRLGDLGVLPHVIEQCVNHQSGHRHGVGGIYNKSIYGREVSAALALWADHMRALVDGGERKVVPLRSNAQPAP